jgi:hypothetical protein
MLFQDIIKEKVDMLFKVKLNTRDILEQIEEVKNFGEKNDNEKRIVEFSNDILYINYYQNYKLFDQIHFFSHLSHHHYHILIFLFSLLSFDVLISYKLSIHLCLFI